MADRKKLGKGLSALLSSGSASSMSNLLSERAVDRGSVLGEEERLRNIPIDLIQRGKYQPRVEMNEAALDDLAASIKAQGVMPVSYTHLTLPTKA